jgi:hypothetical protein
MQREIEADLDNRQADELLNLTRQRLVKWNFNIYDFSFSKGEVKGERNNLEQVLLGLRRDISLKIDNLDDKRKVMFKCGGTIKGVIFMTLLFAIIPVIFWGAKPYHLTNDGLFSILIFAVVGALLNIALGYIYALKFWNWVQEDVKKVTTSE